MITNKSKLYKYGSFHSNNDLTFENDKEVEDYSNALIERENYLAHMAEYHGESLYSKWTVMFNYNGKDYTLLEDL